MAYKRARELYGKRRYREALAEAQLEAKSAKRDLMDEICMHSAATGDVIGFDGKVLQVAPADPDTAWLGVPAQLKDKKANIFSSIADALEAAADGDVIQLLPGTHVVSQVSLNITKRVMLQGVAATAKQVMLDHRANHPAIVISRSCILNNFSIDMVGFCEAVSIIGANITVKPVLRGLHVMCSGDDGVSVAEKSQPLMQRCQIEVRKCGIKQYDSSSLTLWQCNITDCQHGLVAAGSSQCFMEGCHIKNCSEDGIIGLEKSSVHLTGSCVTGCKGPGIDLSNRSSARLKASDIKGCCGGLWLWNNATCEAISSHIDGGGSYAVLLDSAAYACGSSCTIDGPCHDSSEQPLPADVRRASAVRSSSTSQQQSKASQSRPTQQDKTSSSSNKRSFRSDAHHSSRDMSISPISSSSHNAKPSQKPAASESSADATLVVAKSSEPKPPRIRTPRGTPEPEYKHPRRGSITNHSHKSQPQLCSHEVPTSPFSPHSCSGSSLHSSDDLLGLVYSVLEGTAAVTSGECSKKVDGDAAKGDSSHQHVDEELEEFHDPLVSETMLVADAAAAAALFPAEQGAFAFEPSVC